MLGNKKKILLLVLVLLTAFSFVACKNGKTKSVATISEIKAEEKKTIYVLGPTPDHGWNAQAGKYASICCQEINTAGRYNAVYMSSDDGFKQIDQINSILSKNNAAGVVLYALSNDTKAGAEALAVNGIPFILFDRAIDGVNEAAELIYSGDNWQCGAATAYWLEKNGMLPTSTFVMLAGDKGTTVSIRRQEGFEQFLKGDIRYHDEQLHKNYVTDNIWTQKELDDFIPKYKYICDWNSKKAYDYMKEDLPEIVKEAKANDNKLFIFSMDDEMTFGVINLLESDDLSDDIKKDIEDMEVYISAVGGMQEIYDVMSGKSEQSKIASKYFNDMMSVYFSPKMIKNAIYKMVDFCDGNWSYAKGTGIYEPVWIVDKANVYRNEGFEGR